MERRALKKILTILMAFIMSILLPLSDIAYAYNLNLNLTSVQNDRKVEIIRDTRVQDDFIMQ